MRKNLLILGSLVFTASINAQILTYVGGDALVTVKDGALVYSGGGWQNASAGKVDNEGDIMIVGTPGTDKFDIGTSANFTLKYVNSSTYGQLYITGINQTSDITGKVIKEYRATVNNSSTLNTLGRQQVALPFYNFTIGDLKAALEPGATSATWLNTTTTTLNYTGRFNVSSVFKWNSPRSRYDQITGANTTVVGKPTDYYIIPRRSQNATGTAFNLEWDAAASIRNFTGTPVSDQGTDVEVTLTGAAAGISFGINGNAKNYYYERYNSYVTDPFRAGGPFGSPAWHADYGKNLYQVANPFLTNIDLKYIGTNEGANGDGIEVSGLIGIYTFGNATINWQNGVGSTYTTDANRIATLSGGVLQAGDVNSVLIKPMEEFYVKMDGATSPTFNMKNTRRFSQTPRSSITYSGVTGRSESLNIPSDKIVKQVAAILKDSSGNEIGRTYYAVSASAQTGYADSNNLQAYVNDYPIFTKEELLSGGEDTNQTSQVYINAANEIDFAKKEIPLKIASTEATSLSFEIYEGGDLLQTGQQLSTGKSFYIKVNNEITQISQNTNVALSNGDNIGLYYDMPEGSLGSIDNILYQTVIAKKDTDWVVRFAKDWKSADVEVYSATGQLIHSKKSVSTSQDYIIPINSKATGLFIVRTTSETGKIVTKKIVK